MNAPPMQWMIHGVLPMEGFAALYGPSGSGKSFLAIDIAVSVANGNAMWFNRRIVQCPVTYCALEGEAGIGKRIDALRRHHNCTVSDDLRFIMESFDLLKEGDVDGLANAILADHGGDGLVILDTLNRAAPGADENSSADMGAIISNAKRLQAIVGGLVLIVHHTGKDITRGLRGHSSLHAALDSAIEVNKTDGRHEWSVAKSKDDVTGAAHGFKLETVLLGYHNDQIVTSCVALPDDFPSEARLTAKGPSGVNQKRVFAAIKEALSKSNDFGKGGAPEGTPAIRFDDAVSRGEDALAENSAKHRKERAKEAIKGMIAQNIFGEKDNWLWIN